MWRERMHRALSMPRLYRNWPTALSHRLRNPPPDGPPVRYALRGSAVLWLHPGRMGVWIVNEIWTERVYERRPGFAPRPGWVVLDAGANQGVYAVRAARAGASVFAVEPEPRNAALLRRNAGENGGFAVREAALTPDGEPARLALAGINTGGHSVVAGFNPAESPTVAVAGLSLADAVAWAGGRVDLLKLDVEGAEFGLFAAPGWDAIARVVTEYHAVGGMTNAAAEQAATAALQRLGYAVDSDPKNRILYAHR